MSNSPQALGAGTGEKLKYSRAEKHTPGEARAGKGSPKHIHTKPGVKHSIPHHTTAVQAEGYSPYGIRCRRPPPTSHAGTVVEQPSLHSLTAVSCPYPLSFFITSRQPSHAPLSSPYFCLFQKVIASVCRYKSWAGPHDSASTSMNCSPLHQPSLVLFPETACIASHSCMYLDSLVARSNLRQFSRPCPSCIRSLSPSVSSLSLSGSTARSIPLSFH